MAPLDLIAQLLQELNELLDAIADKVAKISGVEQPIPVPVEEED